MEALKIAVCDDQEEEQKRLKEILRKIQSPPVTAVFFSRGEELLEKFSASTYDLILMDIYMDGMSGIDAVAKIREKDPGVPVAFITSSLDFALDSYRLSAIGYIEKPYEPKDIERILNLARTLKINTPSLYAQKNHETIRVPFRDIQYLEQQRHQVSIVCSDGRSVLVYGKIADMMLQLDDNLFCRTHKSFCVNMDFICSVNPELRCLVMKDGTNVPIRREIYPKVRKRYENHLFSKARKNPSEPQ